MILVKVLCGINSRYLRLRGTHVLSVCRAKVYQLEEGHHNPEDCNLNTHCCYIKSYKLTSELKLV